MWANYEMQAVRIKHSIIANNKGGDELLYDPQGTGTALLTAVDDSIMGNQTGVHANAGGFIRIGMDTITDNNTGLMYGTTGRRGTANPGKTTISSATSMQTARPMRRT